MLYIFVLIYLVIALPLAILVWAALVVAKQADSEKERNLRAILFRAYSAQGD
jgi:ABC-type Fe3+ transport system permease subunit